MSTLYPLIVPVAPLIAALFTALPNRYLSHRNYKLGWWFVFAGFVASLVVLWHAIQTPEPVRILLFQTSWEALPVVELSFDRLAAVMMTVISGFGALLYHYSMRYLQQDAGLGRYLTLMALKISFQLFVVSSADLVTLFVFWQVLSWILCLLAHNYAHIPTAQGSFRTFIMLRGGDLAFLAGIALAYHLYGTVQFAPLFERAAELQTQLAIMGTGLTIPGATAVTLLIFIGAMSKSAQIPLHMWLPDSLYAPTPIHALLHAGGINAGGFLLTRLAPLFILSPVTLHVVLVVGLLTAILGTGMMLVQNDIKKTLGYSTIGQMGYMIMECGVGAFPLAVFHLVAHGLFKADIFLNCGKGIHEARLHPERPTLTSQQPATGSGLGWVGAFILSLLVPLGLVIGAHELLGISLLGSQGLLILLLFSWVTASQAMLTVFRLNNTWLSKGAMLVVIGLVATGYFFAAEQFTHFLYPDPRVVEAFFQAAALPEGAFIALAALLVASIALAWFFSVYRQQRAAGRLPAPGLLKLKTYLFLMNRLYLDGVSMRLFGGLRKLGQAADRSPVAFIALAILALALAAAQMPGVPGIPPATLAFMILSALLLPLFPFQGLYVAALTRAPKGLATALCPLMPALGIYTMSWLLPEIPRELLPAIGVLAAVGALWGSIKALLQSRVSHLLAYGGLALYAILWWHFSRAGVMTESALFYAWSVTLVLSGLFLAWDRVRARYGELNLNEIGGLFQPMPRFAVCLALLIMAAVGLPPFGLFFGFLGILFDPSTGVSFELIAIVATWLAASWYLFKLMQRLLFGPHRTDLRYEDLRPIEVIAFVLVITLLAIPSGVSQDWLSTTLTEVSWNFKGMPWIQ